MSLNLPKPLVTIEWLNKHLDHPDLIILNATIPKVSDKKSSVLEKEQIKNARFFDIKNAFSNTSSRLPNTFPSSEQFQNEARNLGVNKNSFIVVYDDYGYYSCARAWWLFKAFSHKNIAVLDGGLPAWKLRGLPTEKMRSFNGAQGDFLAIYQKKFIKNHKDVLNKINESTTIILDARAKERFSGEEPEPREGLRSGHIPNSKNLPYTELVFNGKMISDTELGKIFKRFVKSNDDIIFTCGSGVTACILALGAEKMGYKNLSIYDGSWTEWGGIYDLPIEIGN